ncbi:hypothetical protein F2Q69_00021341 [Brassica cretica]|uniref:Uncharacterized protein n=1 Tax=Brassica cretica TaxID=69181 RepID=A0A8S9QIB7_BRACR|nr:hypothetical protein F2Q69_00021341 [Brassica cretica]
MRRHRSSFYSSLRSIAQAGTSQLRKTHCLLQHAFPAEPPQVKNLSDLQLYAHERLFFISFSDTLPVVIRVSEICDLINQHQTSANASLSVTPPETSIPRD